MTNIMKIIENLKQKGEIYPATRDSVFKSIIQDPDLKDFTAFIISSVCGRYVDVDNMIYVNTEYTKNTIADRVNVTDVLIEINGDRFSLEMNKNNSEELKARNRAHLFEGALKTINISFRDGKVTNFIQICFDNFSIKNKLISVYKLTDIEDGIPDDENNNFIKYRINMVKVFKKYYTDGVELTRFEKSIAILSFNKIIDLRKIAKGDEMLMKVEKKLENLSKNPDMIEYISIEKAMEFGRKLDLEKAKKEGHDSGYSEGIELGKSEGIKLGKSEGIELGKFEGIELGKSEGIELGKSEGIELGKSEGAKQTKIETAKKMLRKGLDIKDIIDITGLSKKDIESL